MNLQNMQNHLLKNFFKVQMVSDVKGRMRLRIANYQYIPLPLVTPYLPLLHTLLVQMHGILNVQLNDKIGSILLQYDAKKTTSATILAQVDSFIETGFKVGDEIVIANLQEENLTPDELQQRYLAKLQQQKEKIQL